MSTRWAVVSISNVSNRALEKTYITGLFGAVVCGVSESAAPLDRPPVEASFCGAESVLLSDCTPDKVSSLPFVSFSGVRAPSEAGVIHWLRIVFFATTECWLCCRLGRGMRPSWRVRFEACSKSEGSM